MKKIYTKKLLAVIFVLTAFVVKTQTSYTWTGATTSFSTTTNWSPNGLPSPGDDIVFDGSISSSNCNVDMAVDVDLITIQNGYSGTINGQSQSFLCTGFSQSSGTFISTDQSLDVAGDFIFSGGTFSHNNGTVAIFVAHGTTKQISGTVVFNVLQIYDEGLASQSAQRNMNFNNGVTTATLELNLASRKFGFQGNVSITKQLDIDGSCVLFPTGNTATFTFNGSSAIINSQSLAGRSYLPNITINTSGALSMSGQVSLTGTWLNTNIGSFTGGSSTVNFYGASGVITGGTTATTRAYFDNINIQTAATLNVTAGSHIDLNANLTHNGTYTGNASLLRFSGTAGNAINGTATLTTINAIEKTGTGTLSFGHATNLLDSIKISGGSVTGTNLTLKSTSALKARIAEISGGGSLTGNITVETFIPGGTTDWAVLGASGVNGLTFNSWYPTIPMSIEGSATGVTSAGGYYFESVQGWDEANAYGYDTTMTIGTSITPGKGYWLFVGTGLSSSADITTVVSGSPVTGNQTPSLSNSAQNGDCLLANPFPSPISWDRIVAANPGVTSGDIWIYNADIGTTTNYAGGVSSHASGAKSTIPMGQGFYVRYSGVGSLSINESMKVSNNTGSNPLIKVNGNTSSSIGNVVRLKVTDGTYADETAIRFHGSATAGFDDNLDSRKAFASPTYAGYASSGPWTKRTSISTKSGAADYAINSLPYATTSNAVIPVLVKAYATGQHTISASDLQNLAIGTCVTLKDKLLNINHNLAASDYVFTLNDTTSAPRFELTVCANMAAGINDNNVSVAQNVFVKQDRNGVYVDLNFEKSTKATITAINTLGQDIMVAKQVECINNRYYLDLLAKEQIVIVNVITPEKRYTQKVYVPNSN